MDSFDLALLDALQRDCAQGNAALGDIVGLSASQVSRRRAALEAAGLVTGYRAMLDHAALGFGIDAFIRVALAAHGSAASEAFAAFLRRLPEIRSAYAVTGNADYLLHARVRTLADLSRLIADDLLPHPSVREVHSEIALDLIKTDAPLALRDPR